MGKSFLLPLGVALLLVGGCKDKTDEKAEAARAVAMVEAAQNRKPPAAPVAPQPITYGEVIHNRMAENTGCAFLPSGGEDGDPILFADNERAVMKINSEFESFASDSGSAERPGGLREHYTGKTWDLRLTLGTTAVLPAGNNAATWNGAVTLRDSFNRAVYSANGTLICRTAGASPAAT